MDIPKYFTDGLDDLLKQLYNLLPDKDRPQEYGALISEISPNRDIEIAQRLYNLVYYLKTDILAEIKDSNFMATLIGSLGMVLITSPKIAAQHKALFDEKTGDFTPITGRLSYYASGIFTYTINHLFEQAVTRCKEKKAPSKSMEHLFTEKMISDTVEDMTESIKVELSAAHQYSFRNDIKKIALITNKLNKNLAIHFGKYQSYENSGVRDVATTQAILKSLQQVQNNLEGDKEYKNSYIDPKIKKEVEMHSPAIKNPTLLSDEEIKLAQELSTALGETIEKNSSMLTTHLTTLEGDLALGQQYETLVKQIEAVKTKLSSAIDRPNADIDACYKTAFSDLKNINFTNLPETASKTTQRIYQEQFEKAQLEAKTYLETRHQFHRELIQAFDEQKNAILELKNRLDAYDTVEKISTLSETELNNLSDMLNTFSQELKTSTDPKNTLAAWKQKKDPSNKLADEFLNDFNNSEMSPSVKKDIKTLEASIQENLTKKLAAIDLRRTTLESENVEKINELKEKINELDKKIDDSKNKQANINIEPSHVELMKKRAELFKKLKVPPEPQHFDTLASLYLNPEQRKTSLYEKIEKERALRQKEVVVSAQKFSMHEKTYNEELSKFQKLTALKQSIEDAFNKKKSFEIPLKELSSNKDLFRQLLGKNISGKDNYDELLTILKAQHESEISLLPNIRRFYNDPQICQNIFAKSLQPQKELLESYKDTKDLASNLLSKTKETQQIYEKNIQALKDFDHASEPKFAEAKSLKAELEQLNVDREVTQLRLQVTQLRTNITQQRTSLQALEKSLNEINPPTSAFSGDLTEKTQWASYSSTRQNTLENLSSQLQKDADQLVLLQTKLQGCTEAQKTLQQALDKFSPTENKDVQSFIQINQDSLQDIETLNNKRQELEKNQQIKSKNLDSENTRFAQEKKNVDEFNNHLSIIDILTQNIDKFTNRLGPNLSASEKDQIIQTAESNIKKFDEILTEFVNKQPDPFSSEKVFNDAFNKKIDPAREKITALTSKKEAYIQQYTQEKAQARTDLINRFAQLTNTDGDLKSLADKASEQYQAALPQFILDTLKAIGEQAKKEGTTDAQHLKAQQERAITVMNLLVPKLSTIEAVNQLKTLTDIKDKEKDSPYAFIRLERPTKGNDAPKYSNTHCWSKIIKPIKTQLLHLAENLSQEKKAFFHDKDKYQASKSILQTHRKFGWFTTATESSQRLEKLKEQYEKAEDKKEHRNTLQK